LLAERTELSKQYKRHRERERRAAKRARLYGDGAPAAPAVADVAPVAAPAGLGSSLAGQGGLLDGAPAAQEDPEGEMDFELDLFGPPSPIVG
jgi:hypothetical protein